MAVALTLRVAHQWAGSLVTAPQTASSSPRLAGSRQRGNGFIEEGRRGVRDGFEANISLQSFEPTTRSRRA